MGKLRSRLAWVALLSATAAVFWGLYASAHIPTPRTAGNPPGLRRLQTPEIREGVRIGERFKMSADQFTALDIRASAVGTPRGVFQLELWSLADDRVTIMRAEDVPAADLVQKEIFQFRFAPIINSRNVRYMFEVSASPGSQAGGVALWATKGRDDVDSVLLFNTNERFADLVFETHVVPPEPMGTAIRWQVWVALAGLAVSWTVLVAMFDRWMVVRT